MLWRFLSVFEVARYYAVHWLNQLIGHTCEVERNICNTAVCDIAAFGKEDRGFRLASINKRFEAGGGFVFAGFYFNGNDLGTVLN